MYAARKSGLKKEMFGYVSGGYNIINTRFAEYLQKLGVEFKLNAAVNQVYALENDAVGIRINNENEYRFDHVISTLSPHQSVKLADSLPEKEKAHHRNVKYLGVICPSVLLNKSISPYYVTNITDSDTPFTGIIEMTALIDKNMELKGKNLIYLPKYVDSDDKLFDADDDEIKKIFLGALFKMYPDFSEQDVLYFGVSKAKNVFALPTIDYSIHLPGISTSLKNFYIINSSQIINGTQNVNESIHVAESKLKILLDGAR
jgi:protoporphyrinogen oxidase